MAIDPLHLRSGFIVARYRLNRPNLSRDGATGHGTLPKVRRWRCTGRKERPASVALSWLSLQLPCEQKVDIECRGERPRFGLKCRRADVPCTGAHQDCAADYGTIESGAAAEPSNRRRADEATCRFAVASALIFVLPQQSEPVVKLDHMFRAGIRQPRGRRTRAASRKFFGAKMLITRSTEASCTGHSLHTSATAKASIDHRRAA